METNQSTEQKIKEAARKIFLQQGFAGARMQDIADEAGINKALLHYYFRSKEKLFEIIFLETVGVILPKVQQIFVSDLHLFDKIRQAVHTYLTVIDANPFIPLFVLTELNKNPDVLVQKFLSAVPQRPDFSKLLVQVMAMVEKGEIRAVNPYQLVINTLGLCVFPYMGKPLIKTLLRLNDEEFQTLLNDRKTQVAEFIIHSLRV